LRNFITHRIPSMSTFSRAAFAAGILLFSLASSTMNAVPAPPVAADAYGDPLPAGVIARLGTLRLRHTCIALAWAPDGQTLASAGWDGTIRIWDAASGKQVRQCKGWQSGNIQALTYLPDGKTLACKGNDSMLHVWDTATAREVRTLFPAQQQAAALAPGAEDDMLVELCTDNTLHVWDLTTGRESSHLELSRGKQQSRVALSADGKRVAGWGFPDDLTVWDASTGKELFHAATQLKTPMSLTFSRDGKIVAASGAPGQIVTWDAESGKELRRYEGAGFLQWLTFSQDGKYVAGIGGDRAVHLWSLAEGKELRHFESPASCGPSWAGVGALAFSPDAKTVAASQGAVIHFWNVETGKLLQRFTGHTAAVDDVRFSADSHRVVSCGKDGMARLWDVGTAKEIASWANTHGSAEIASWADTAASAFSIIAAPDGESVLAAMPGGWLRVKLGGDKPEEASPTAGAPDGVWNSSFALSGDGKTLLGIGTGQDRSLHLWDMETNKERSRLPIAIYSFGVSALSPDGKFLAEGGVNTPIRLWDLVTAKAIRTFGEAPAPGQVRYAVSLAFSPDGWSLLEVGSSELTLYEVATGRERMRIMQPSGVFGRSPNSAVFSPDGETIAAATFGGTIVLFDANNGRERTRLTGPTNVVTSMAFAPDGKSLAAGDVEGMVLVWDVKEWAAPARPASAELKPEKLASLWETLSDADAGKAYKAITALAASPKASASYLKGKLTETDARFARWIQDLSSDKLDVREKAEKELEKEEGSAVPALRKALESNPPPESRLLLQALLNRQKDSAKVTEEVRARRALEALERAGSADAIGVLEDLAKDGPGATVKKEAKAALIRLIRLTRRSAAH
jgi:WD40 repeat protein